MATPRPFVSDPILTAVTVGYTNPAGARIADQVLPRSPVGAEEFKWTHYPLEEGFALPDAKVGRRGRVQQLEFTGEERTDAVEDYGLDTPIPYSDIEKAAEARARRTTSYDPERHSVMMLTETMLNIREVRVANMVQDAANYSSGRKVALSGTDRFSDYANSDPIGVIKTACDSTLIYRPNTMVMGREAWSKLSSHPDIVNAIKGNVTSQGIVTMAEVANLFAGEGISQVLVGDAWANVAKKGQPVSLQRSWGKHIALLHVNPMAAVEGGGITFGMTAELGRRIAGRIEDEDVGLQGGVRIRAGERVKELIIAPDVGYLIQNAVA